MFLGRLKTAAAINTANAEFWRVASSLLIDALADEKQRDWVLNRIEVDELLGRQLIYRKSLEGVVEERERDRRAMELVKQNARHELAVKGGTARKKDALQNLIEREIAHRPDIGVGGLLQMLKAQSPGSVIAQIDTNEGDIELRDGKCVPVSGLKDRLYRARKFLKSSNR